MPLKAATTQCAQELLDDGLRVQLLARGGSMRPFVQDGDVLGLARNLDMLRVGDVIWLALEDRDLIHRLVEVDPIRGLRTRGDALPQDDGWFDPCVYMATLVTVERDGTVRPTPDTKGHRCLVAFLRGLRHIYWKLA